MALFVRRGVVNEFVTLASKLPPNDANSFGCILRNDEEPVLRILPRWASNECWLTTQRLAWKCGNQIHELYLSDLESVIQRFFETINASDTDALRIRTRQGDTWDIELPDQDIVIGLLCVLLRYERSRKE